MLDLISKKRIIFMESSGSGSGSGSSSGNGSGSGTGSGSSSNGGTGTSGNGNSGNGESGSTGGSDSGSGGSDGGSESSTASQSTLGTNDYTPGTHTSDGKTARGTEGDYSVSQSLNGIYNSDGKQTSSFVDNGHGVYTKSMDTYDDRGNKVNQDYVNMFYGPGKEALSYDEKSARNRMNGINDWGKNMDKNNDGKIGFFENALMSITNKAKAADMALGGIDQYGANKAGNMNGINQGRGKNMAQNFADAMNKAFGGIGKYDGTTKNGEHFTPGTKAGFLGRLGNIGKGMLTAKGKTWNDTNGDGKMNGGELGKAALANLAINAISKAPMVGKSVGSFLSGAVSDGSRAQSGFWGQLGQQVATNNKGTSNPSVSVGPSTSSSGGPSGNNTNNKPNSELENAIIKPAINDAKNFKANMKQHQMDVPLTSATYVSRKDNNDRAVTVSDERSKGFAKRRLFR